MYKQKHAQHILNFYSQFPWKEKVPKPSKCLGETETTLIFVENNCPLFAE